MKDLIKTASILDKILHILYIATMVGAITCVVGLGIIAMGVVFDLPPHMIGTGFQNADLGNITISVAEDQMPAFSVILGKIAVEIALTLLCLLIARKMVACVRGILSPMKEGAPFHTGISANLKTLAIYSCIIGVTMNVKDILSNSLTVMAYDLANVIVNDQITHISITNVFDLSFLFIAGILLLLNYVFRYGEELQQLSDETV